VLIVIVTLAILGVFNSKVRSNTTDPDLPKLTDGYVWRIVRSQPLVPEEEDGWLKLEIVSSRGKVVTSALMDKITMATPEGHAREIRRAAAAAMERLYARKRGTV